MSKIILQHQLSVQNFIISCCFLIFKFGITNAWWRKCFWTEWLVENMAKLQTGRVENGEKFLLIPACPTVSYIPVCWYFSAQNRPDGETITVRCELAADLLVWMTESVNIEKETGSASWHFAAFHSWCCVACLVSYDQLFWSALMTSVINSITMQIGWCWLGHQSIGAPLTNANSLLYTDRV